MSSDTAPNYALLDDGPSLIGTMFHPRPNDRPAPSGASDHVIEVEPDITLGARFYPTDPAGPTLLYFHGNGEVASDHDGIAPMYHELGINLFVVDFRGYGDSGGSPTMATLVSDALPAAAFFHRLLDEASFSKARYIMGRSLGAHPALEAAANAQGFRGLILESGASNIRRTVERRGLLDTELGGRLAAAHDAKVGRITMPVLLIHGEVDNLVPLNTATTTRDLLTSTTVQLEVVPRAGHNDLLWVGREQYFNAIKKFVGGDEN